MSELNPRLRKPTDPSNNCRMKDSLPNHFRSLILLAALGASMAMVAGCEWKPQKINYPNLALCSGQVFLDDEPVPNAKIIFIPTSKRDSDDWPLPISYDTTDEDGFFTMKVFSGQLGAAIGKNQVWIVTREIEESAEGNEVDPEILREELIPKKYNSHSTLFYDVDPKGTSKAIIKLTSE